MQYAKNYCDESVQLCYSDWKAVKDKVGQLIGKKGENGKYGKQVDNSGEDGYLQQYLHYMNSQAFFDQLWIALWWRVRYLDMAENTCQNRTGSTRDECAENCALHPSTCQCKYGCEGDGEVEPPYDRYAKDCNRCKNGKLEKYLNARKDMYNYRTKSSTALQTIAQCSKDTTWALDQHCNGGPPEKCNYAGMAGIEYWGYGWSPTFCQGGRHAGDNKVFMMLGKNWSAKSCHERFTELEQQNPQLGTVCGSFPKFPGDHGCMFPRGGYWPDRDKYSEGICKGPADPAYDFVLAASPVMCIKDAYAGDQPNLLCGSVFTDSNNWT